MDIILSYFSDFTPRQIEQFKMLGPLYNEWNSKINVISRKDIDSLYEKHVLHSLAIAAVFEFKPGSAVIDIGTGGGFPGIPLAIYFPEVQFHLVDSIGKKLKIVNEIKTRQFDYAVSRAVAPLKDLWHWSKPLLKKKKKLADEDELLPGLICLKGGDLAQEIQESGTRPRIMPISELFKEESFHEKYLLYVTR